MNSQASKLFSEQQWPVGPSCKFHHVLESSHEEQLFHERHSVEVL